MSNETSTLKAQEIVRLYSSDEWGAHELAGAIAAAIEAAESFGRERAISEGIRLITARMDHYQEQDPSAGSENWARLHEAMWIARELAYMSVDAAAARTASEGGAE